MVLRLAGYANVVLATWLAACGGMGFPSPARAASPQVVFDTPAVVAVRDVTTPEFSILNPGEKLVEVSWHVSALVARGAVGDLEEVVVTLQSPERRARVIDYWPQTELTNDIVGAIQTTTAAEQNASLKLNIVGGWPVPAGPLHGDLDAQKSQRNSTNQQFQRLPPRTAVVASGTILQGHGAFFKLRRWSQASLEGAHPFRAVLAVPQAWRGDWVLITAEARGVEQNLFGSLAVEAGQNQFAVGLHLEADREARQAVEKLVSLRRQGLSQRSDAPLPKFAELFSGKSASTARQQHERAVSESLRAVQKLSGLTNVR